MAGAGPREQNAQAFTLQLPGESHQDPQLIQRSEGEPRVFLNLYPAHHEIPITIVCLNRGHTSQDLAADSSQSV